MPRALSIENHLGGFLVGAVHWSNNPCWFCCLLACLFLLLLTRTYSVFSKGSDIFIGSSDENWKHLQGKGRVTCDSYVENI